MNSTNIRELTLQDRPMVMDYLRQYPTEVSELTFSNLFVWRFSRPISFVRHEDSLIFFAPANTGPEGAFVVFGPPLGLVSPAVVPDLLESNVQGMVRIPSSIAEPLENGDFCVLEDRDNFDYVYTVSDLAGLEGRRYHKKRNLIKQCLKNYTCRYETIDSGTAGECMRMQEQWCEIRDCGLNPGLCSEYQAIKETFDHYESLDLIGGAIRVDGTIQAFSIGESLFAGTAVWHFEKAMPAIQGLGQLINQWFARNALRDFDFVNREQDLGIPGLRQAKKSYFPHHMVRKFKAFPKSMEEAACCVAEPHECAKHMHGENTGEMP